MLGGFLFGVAEGKISEVAIVVQNDPEAFAFSLQLISIFQEAGAKIHAPEAPRADKWFVPNGGLLIYSPKGVNESDLKGDVLYEALKSAHLFGGSTGKPFNSGQPHFHYPDFEVIPEYNVYVVYIGQKSPF